MDPRSSAQYHIIFEDVVWLDKFIYSEEKFRVLRGRYNGIGIVGKVANKGFEGDLTHEYRSYQQLRMLQGICIPICLGLFQANGVGTILILEDCGEQVAEGFGGVTEDQK